MGKCCGAPCHHEVCLIESALHRRGACTEHDQIVPGHYCPISVCRLNARRGSLPADYGRLEPIRAEEIADPHHGGLALRLSGDGEGAR